MPREVTLPIEILAAIAYEAVVHYRLAQGHRHPSWNDADTDNRAGTLDALRWHLENPYSTAAQGHDAWADIWFDEGWKWAPKYSEKKKTNPRLVPFDQADEAVRVERYIIKGLADMNATTLAGVRDDDADAELLDTDRVNAEIAMAEAVEKGWAAEASGTLVEGACLAAAAPCDVVTDSLHGLHLCSANGRFVIAHDSDHLTLHRGQIRALRDMILSRADLAPPATVLREVTVGRRAHAYLSGVLGHIAPGIRIDPDLLVLCTQLDNVIAGMRHTPPDRYFPGEIVMLEGSCLVRYDRPLHASNGDVFHIIAAPNRPQHRPWVVPDDEVRGIGTDRFVVLDHHGKHEVVEVTSECAPDFSRSWGTFDTLDAATRVAEGLQYGWNHRLELLQGVDEPKKAA